MVLGMFSLEIECDPTDRDLLIAELWDTGSAGIVELSPVRVRAFFEDSADRTHLLRLFPGASLRIEEQRDWVQSARDLLQPMEIGARFFLVPEWRDDPAPSGRFRIAVNPGMAFGTGVHETTRLCIEALEDYLKPGMVMLDVGTGSGILAKAAQLLGAGRVYACDTDPVAVEIAGQRVRRIGGRCCLRLRRPSGCQHQPRSHYRGRVRTAARAAAGRRAARERLRTTGSRCGQSRARRGARGAHQG